MCLLKACAMFTWGLMKCIGWWRPGWLVAVECSLTPKMSKWALFHCPFPTFFELRSFSIGASVDGKCPGKWRVVESRGVEPEPFYPGVGWDSYESDGDARRLVKWCKLWILVSLRVFRTERWYFKPWRYRLGLYAKELKKHSHTV